MRVPERITGDEKEEGNERTQQKDERVMDHHQHHHNHNPNDYKVFANIYEQTIEISLVVS